MLRSRRVTRLVLAMMAALACADAAPILTLPAYAQCGGLSAPPAGVRAGDAAWPHRVCAAGTACDRRNAYYWQCVPSSSSSRPSPSPDPTPSDATRPLPTCAVCPPAPAPAPSSGAAAKTTRYWDCCKPSCAWAGKAALQRSSAPVQTCAADGASLRAQPDAASGCVGGSAFTCNTQQPWVVNDTFAYGFAAAKLAGQGEDDWCCACYRLRFTSGAVAGKTMVVQVTNTGGDLGDNHFDLAIPGGGQGIFSGCSAQYPHIPRAAWGAQYGGVSSAAQCDALPAPIRAGCRFRFGWGRGMDNPEASFTRVPCPAELVLRSGCARAAAL